MQFMTFSSSHPKERGNLSNHWSLERMFDNLVSRNKILFITWSPDTARVRVCLTPLSSSLTTFLTHLQSKMVYASSRASLRDSLNGIGGEIQATDLSEIDYTTVLEKVAKVKSGN